MIFLRSPRFLTALIALLAIASSPLTASAQGQDKLDRALRDGKRSGKPQRVIVKARGGYEAWARQLLAARGKNIDAELPSINAVALELQADELDEICGNAIFASCSEDSYVTPSGAANGNGNGNGNVRKNPLTSA